MVSKGTGNDSTKVSVKRIERSLEDAYIVNGMGKQTLFVNEEVTTHVIMPEPIKLVDISTQKIAGNQCADNIVRIKPVEKMFEHELIGTITVIGERNMVQYDVVYTRLPNYAYSVYKVSNAELDRYTNPGVSMTEGEMARFAYNIFNSPRQFYGIKQSKYGMTIRVNNIYTLNDYFFIDYSLYNKSNIKYDIDEVRIKLTDKEFAILCFLLQNRGRVVSFQELSDAVWQDEVYISRSGCLAVHVNHIREKLHDRKPFATVKTAWGKGYWVE